MVLWSNMMGTIYIYIYIVQCYVNGIWYILDFLFNIGFGILHFVLNYSFPGIIGFFMAFRVHKGFFRWMVLQGILFILWISLPEMLVFQSYE